MDTQLLFDQYKCCVLIPTYNNEKTVGKVISDVLEYTRNVIVVNDGATDSTPSILAGFGNKIDVVTHSPNKGKGRALQNGFQRARELGYDFAISIDSDGQHFASDLPSFLAEIEKNPKALVIGARNMSQENVPGKSSFGNKFSNFWFWVETGIKMDDTQSGYRLYPISIMSKKYLTNRFEFEIEVIVKAAWKGIEVKNVPVKVYYAPGKERITHFRPGPDFTRISFMNAYLVTLALLFYIPLRFFKSLTKENIKSFVKKNFFNKEESIQKKAFSIGFGIFMGIFPVWGYQMLIGLTLSHFFKLNKALFTVAANISFPPFIPFIIYGSYQAGALIVPNPKNDLLFNTGITLELIKANFGQYFFGAVALSFVSGLLATALTYGILWAKR